MPVYDMKCPRCGKQSTEYDENKWQCLHCGNKFVYKEESDTYNTSVNIDSSALFDLDKAGPSYETPLREPYLKWHSLKDDAEFQASKNHSLVPRSFKDDDGQITMWGCFGLLAFLGLPIMFMATISGNPAEDGFRVTPGTFILPLILVCYLINRSVKKRHEQLAAARESHLSSIEETVGWITLCPFCKKSHSKYYHDDQEPETGPTHCKSCGKQFMLLNGKARTIKTPL